MDKEGCICNVLQLLMDREGRVGNVLLLDREECVFHVLCDMRVGDICTDVIVQGAGVPPLSRDKSMPA